MGSYNSVPDNKVLLCFTIYESKNHEVIGTLYVQNLKNKTYFR
jgi:hypothetical protein